MKKPLKTKIDELPITQSTSHTIINIKKINEESQELPGYENIKYDINLKKESSVCWNCCHKIPGKVLCQPVNYENGVFNLIGNFCSPACIARYIMDSNQATDVIFSKLSYLNLYISMINKTNHQKITPAPPRLALSMFGGDLDIDTYRKYNENYLTLIDIEPVVSFIDIKIKNIPYKNNTITETKKEFKLYRKNKKNSNNDIYSSMKLISD